MIGLLRRCGEYECQSETVTCGCLWWVRFGIARMMSTMGLLCPEQPIQDEMLEEVCVGPTTDSLISSM